MNKIILKKVACLVSEAELEQLRVLQRSRQHHNAPATYLHQRVWREIQVIATDTGVSIHLGNIDEDAVRTGYWNASESCVRFTLTWDELADVNSLENMLRFEPLVVAKPLLEMLAKLKAMSSSIRDVMAI